MNILYISGKSGAGKTECIRSLVNELENTYNYKIIDCPSSDIQNYRYGNNLDFILLLENKPKMILINSAGDKRSHANLASYLCYIYPKFNLPSDFIVISALRLKQSSIRSDMVSVLYNFGMSKYYCSPYSTEIVMGPPASSNIGNLTLLKNIYRANIVNCCLNILTQSQFGYNI